MVKHILIYQPPQLWRLTRLMNGSMSMFGENLVRENKPRNTILRWTASSRKLSDYVKTVIASDEITQKNAEISQTVRVCAF